MDMGYKCYFDNAATTPVNGYVADVVSYNLRDLEDCGNPSSLYSIGKSAKLRVDEARKHIAQFINSEASEIYFTSGASESNSWAIQGFVKQMYSEGKRVVLMRTSIEHNSIVACMNDLNNSESSFGSNIINVLEIPTDNDGIVDTKYLERYLEMVGDIQNSYNEMGDTREVKIFVSCQLANNEIGTIQPMADIVRLVHKFGGIVHCDATQVFGHLPIDVKTLDVDMLTASGHKVNAPKGIGILYIKNGIEIKPIIYGTQESGMRGGTENVAFIEALSEAVYQCDISSETIACTIKLRDYLMKELENRGCKINGDRDIRLPNNVNATFTKNMTGEGMIYILDTAGYYISSGSACNSRSNEPSHVLKAIGLSDTEAMKTIRISLPIITSKDYNDIKFDVDGLLVEIDKALKLFDMENNDGKS